MSAVIGMESKHGKDQVPILPSATLESFRAKENTPK